MTRGTTHETSTTDTETQTIQGTRKHKPYKERGNINHANEERTPTHRYLRMHNHTHINGRTMSHKHSRYTHKHMRKCNGHTNCKHGNTARSQRARTRTQTRNALFGRSSRLPAGKQAGKQAKVDQANLMRKNNTHLIRCHIGNWYVSKTDFGPKHIVVVLWFPFKLTATRVPSRKDTRTHTHTHQIVAVVLTRESLYVCFLTEPRKQPSIHLTRALIMVFNPQSGNHNCCETWDGHALP